MIDETECDPTYWNEDYVATQEGIWPETKDIC